MELPFWGLISYRVSLRVGTCYEDQADLRCRHLPASAPLSARIKGFHDHSCPGHLAPDQRRVSVHGVPAAVCSLPVAIHIYIEHPRLQVPKFTVILRHSLDSTQLGLPGLSTDIRTLLPGQSSSILPSPAHRPESMPQTAHQCTVLTML